MKGPANGQHSWGFFSDAQGFEQMNAGSRAGFTSSRLPPPWALVLLKAHFLYFCSMMCDLEKLGLVNQN